MSPVERYVLLPHMWQWGWCDCTLFVADWVVEATTVRDTDTDADGRPVVVTPGRDPGEGLRGTYWSAEGAEAILRTYGGPEALVDARLAAVGCHRTTDPADGDVGMVRVPTGLDTDSVVVKEIPAIKFGPLWAVMSARGPMVKRLDHTGAAWRIA